MSRPHFALHEHIARKWRTSFFDDVITAAAIIYPLTGVPQVIEVFSGNVAGVSLLSWIGFTLFSALFLVYGIINKLRPIIITDSLWIVVNGLVVVGILVKG
jgi:uncharacterized protein with PQ loop repeat